MNLIDQIKADLLIARKEKSEFVGTLNSLLSESVMVGKNIANRVSTDEEVISVVKKFIKNLNETLSMIGSSSEYDAVRNKIEKEITLLEKYLPIQLTEEKIREILSDLNTKNIGEMMSHLKNNFAGLYDGKIASAIAKELS